MPELTFATLESVQMWGVPTSIDDLALTLTQARVLAGMVEKFMDEAGHPKERAVGLALGVFRRMYERAPDGGWQALRSARVGSSVVRSKFHKVDSRERAMARARMKSAKPQERKEQASSARPWTELAEQGARHGKADKERIFGAVRSLIAALNADDQAALLKDVKKRHGISLRFRVSPPQKGNAPLTVAPSSEGTGKP